MKKFLLLYLLFAEIEKKILYLPAILMQPTKLLLVFIFLSLNIWILRFRMIRNTHIMAMSCWDHFKFCHKQPQQQNRKKNYANALISIANDVSHRKKNTDIWNWHLKLIAIKRNANKFNRTDGISSLVSIVYFAISKTTRRARAHTHKITKKITIQTT